MDASAGLTFEIVDGPDVGQGDCEQIARLLDRAFGGWPRMGLAVPQVEHLRWKLEGPPGQPSRLVLVRDGSRVVALTLSIALRFLARGGECRVRLGADAAVDPEYQGRGIDAARRAFQFERLEPEFDLTLAYATNPSIIQGQLKLGSPRIASSVVTLFRLLDARRALAELPAWRRTRLPVGLGVAAFALVRPWLGRLRDRPPSASPSWSLTTVDRFDERMDDFARRAAEPFDLIQLRNQGYLNWRFCDARAGRFTARLAEENGEVLGFCVVKVSRGRGCIADLLALPGRTDVVGSLIDDAIDVVRDADGYGLDCWITTRHPYAGVLRQRGFFDRRSQAPLRVRAPHRPQLLDLLLDPTATVHLAMGDSDLV